MKELWNRRFETMSWAHLHEYWLENFRMLIGYVRDNSAFYREHLNGVKPGAIKTFESLTDIPFMTKDLIRDAQRSATSGEPMGSIQVARTDDIVQVISSSGTTGRRVYYGATRKDLRAWQDAIACYFFTSGVRKQDVVAHAVGIPMYAGGEPYFNGIRHVGAAVVWVGGQSTVKILEAVRDLHCTVFHATASFDLYLAEHCKETLGIDARDLGVKKVIGGGEPGLGEESMRRRVKEAWGAETVRESMGLADVMPGMWAECEDESGMHFTAQKYVLVELTDPSTGRHLPWEPGVCGEPVYTPILREATPLVRYRSRDLVRVEAVDCRCGRTSPKIRCIGRVDDMLIYKAMNVFPSAIRDVIVTGFEPLITGYVQVVKERAGQVSFDDPIPVDIEVKSQTGDQAKLKRQIEAKVREVLNVRIEANLVPPGTIERTEYKTPLIRVRAKPYIGQNR